jgi:hypothetical protein
MRVDADLLKSLHPCVQRTVVEHENVDTGRLFSLDQIHVGGVSSIGWMPDGSLQVVYEAELRNHCYVVEFRKYPNEEIFRAYLRHPFRPDGSPMVLLWERNIGALPSRWYYRVAYGEK